jgi:uncharacterized protein YndB with AHSA1/START domain
MSVEQIATDTTILVMQADFPGVSVQTVFAYWTQPRLLEQWWVQKAELDAREGGIYHFSWPSIHQDLRGHYLSYIPDERLAFTWKWDDDTEEYGERLVTLAFAVLPEQGTRLTLTHGPYGVTAEEQAIRLEHHLAGWMHFLPHLQATITGKQL